MDFEFSEEHKKFRQEVRDFLDKEVTEDLINEVEAAQGWGPHIWKYMSKLGAKGWLALSMPKEYGGMGATHIQRVIFEDEMGYHLAAPLMVASSWVAPTLLMYGSEEQKREYIPRIAKV
jgi:alkylation response protein AidB-like acyl-CoA dehydrogenase